MYFSAFHVGNYLQVTVSDSGVPSLASTTRVVISVDDINDHAPEFDQPYYKVLVPASDNSNLQVFQVSFFWTFTQKINKK